MLVVTIDAVLAADDSVRFAGVAVKRDFGGLFSALIRKPEHG
ncbi:MAG: hypothetical protein JWM32_3133 [Verrucomicrobia bacterium]|nr:hypothetical protein [Verrucomicrobiota bacterium]